MQRLRGRNEFQQVFSQGRRVQSPFALLLVLPRPSAARPVGRRDPKPASGGPGGRPAEAGLATPLGGALPNSPGATLRLISGQARSLPKRRETEEIRVGFSVGRRFGGAVKRNYLRRRLREACRLELAGRQTAQNWEVVCLPRSRAVEADFASLRAALRDLLARAGVIMRVES